MTDSVLSDAQRQYLRTLNENPMFRSILDALEQHSEVSPFSPHGGTSQEQFSRYVYQSGRVADRRQVLLLLSNGRRGQPGVVDSEE